MVPQPPIGQGPVDPQGAFLPPPPPPGFTLHASGPSGGFGPPPPPPPGFFHPGMMFPPQRPRGFARAIFVTLASTIFGFSLLANIYLLLYGAILSTDATSVLEHTIVDGNADQKIAVIPVRGLLIDETVFVVGRYFRAAQNDPNVKAVVIEVDSPGGTVTASDQLHHLVQKLKKARADGGGAFPVVVSMGGVAASGGYYFSAPADQIFAQHTTLTGSIGVLLPRYNISSLADKWGVTENTLAAPQGGYKNAGSMLKPDDPRDSKYLQGVIDQAYDRFKDVVVKGRAGKLNGSISDIANGQIYTSQQAVKNGLVDQIGYLEDAYTWAAGQAGLSKPTVVKYQRRASFLETLLAGSNVPAPQAVNVNLKLDAAAIDALTSPRLMYLWRGE